MRTPRSKCNMLALSVLGFACGGGGSDVAGIIANQRQVEWWPVRGEVESWTSRW